MLIHPCSFLLHNNLKGSNAYSITFFTKDFMYFRIYHVLAAKFINIFFIWHQLPGISIHFTSRGKLSRSSFRNSQKISIHSLLAEGDSKNAQKYLLPTYILHTKPTITQANPSLKLIFSNLFSKLTPFSRCESPTHFMCTYHSHLNHISNFFKPVPSPQLFPLFRYFDPG